jgi:hypothetical protein
MKIYILLLLVGLSSAVSACQPKDDYYTKFGRPATLVKRG